MNFKKLKRLLSVMLSVTMVLSSNMTGLAAEVAAPTQANPVAAEEIQDTQAHEHDWELLKVKRAATADKEGLGEFQCEECGETTQMAIARTVAEDSEPNTSDQNQGENPPADNTIHVGAADGPTLLEAITAAKPDKTISLDADITLSDENGVYEFGNLTVNTNGHTIKIAANASVTLKGGNFVDSTTITNWPNSIKQMIVAEAGATLAIQNGTYRSKGAYILTANGAVEVTASDFITEDVYHEAVAVYVSGGELTMHSGSIKTNNGDFSSLTANQGMYGLYVANNGKAILGDNESSDLTIESSLAAISLNHDYAPATLEIHGGSYTSHAAYDANSGLERENAVIYLPGKCSTVITGGTFTAVKPEGNAAVQHVISIPVSASYNQDNFRNISISGGTFTSGASVFHTEGVADGEQPSKDLVSFDITDGEFSSDVSKYMFGNFQCQKNEATGKYEIVEKDSTSVALVNGVGYASLAEAFNKAIATATAEKPVKVEMTNDAALGGAATFTFANVEIQTNGHMITIQDGARIKFVGAKIDNKEASKKTNGNWGSESHVMLNVVKGSKLVIQGGTYTSAGINMLAIKGNVTIDGNPTFKCTREDVAASQEYDGTAMFTVSGMDALLTMNSGTIQAKAGANTNCGMYGIYVKSDGKIVLGTKNEDGSKTGPTIETTFAAVGMNGTQPTASVIINGGTYKSSVNCTADNEKKFNAVLYLSVTSNVVINGGTFEATADNADAHVISAPYAKVNGQDNPVKLVIYDGSFSTKGEIFYWSDGLEKGVVRGGTFSKDPGADFVNAQFQATAPSGEGGMWGITSKEHTHSAGTPVAEVKATCQKEGMLFHYECPDCHEMFADQSCTVPLTAEDVKIPRESHDGVFREAADATCTTPKHIAYYECKNCHLKYKSIEDLMNNATPLIEDELYPDGKDTAGHTYTEYVFNWSEILGGTQTITYEKFAEIQAGLANGAITVTVERQCENCDAIDADFDAEVSVELDDASKQAVEELDCTKDVELTYVATVTENTTQQPANPEGSDVGSQADTDPVTRELKVKLTKNQTHDYALTVTEADKQPGAINYQKGVTKFQATRQCKYCTAASETATKNVRVKAEPETDCVLDKPNVELSVEADFGTESTPDIQEGKVTVTVKATGHNFTGNAYHRKVESTCIQAGSCAYYQCQNANCGKKFTNPTSTGEELSDADVASVKKPHTFGLPVCEWENEVVRASGKANAVFTCLSFSGRVTVGGLNVGDSQYADPSKKYECSDKADLIYDVPVTFNKAHVDDTNTTPDAFGDRHYQYSASVIAGKEDQDQDITYKGAIREQAVKGHKFTVTLDWADKDDADLKYVVDKNGDPVTDIEGNKIPYHNPEKGIIATLSCADCGGIVHINSTNNKVTYDNTEAEKKGLKGVQAASGKVVFIENKDAAGYVQNRCTTDGMSFYDATVTCRTDDGKPQATYPGNGEGVLPLRISTTTEKKGHDWYIASSDDVKWEDPNYASYPTQKGDVLVRVKCASDKDHDTVLIGEEAGVVLTEVPLGADGSGAHGAHALTCTEDGVNVWTVSVDVPYGRNGDKITKFEQKTREKAEDAAGDKQPTDGAVTEGDIFVSKTVAAKGHKYAAPKFNWGDYFNPANAADDVPVDVDKSKPVYLEYECTNANCSLKADTDATRDPDCAADKGESFTDQNGDKHWRKRLIATVTDAPVTGAEASCNTSGKVTYTASVAGKTDVQTKTVKKLGHDWVHATAVWSEAPTLVANQTITVGGQPVPVYSVKLTRTCQRCKDDQDKTGNEDVITATLGETEETCTKSTADGSYVLLSNIRNQNETCDKDSTGYTTFTATLYNAAGAAQGTPQSYRVDRNGKQHTYNLENVHVDWETLKEVDEHADEKNPTLITGRHFEVDAYIPCDAKPSDTGHRRPIKVDVTVEGACGETGGVTYKATISKDETDAAQLKFAAEAPASPSTEATYGYEGEHNPTLVRASSDTTLNCESPYYPRHWHCNHCGNNYATSAMNNKVDVSFTGREHKYEDAPAFSWIKEGTTAQAVFTCSVCGQSEIVKEATLDTVNEYVKPGCIGTGEKGYTYYAFWVQFDANSPRYEYEFEVEIAPVPHNLDDKGVCTICKKPFVQVVFNRRTGGALQQVFYNREGSGDNVVIKDVNGKTITATDIAVPTVPQQTGYEFKGWKFGEETEIPSTEIAAKIYTALTTTEATTITVEPNYQPIAKKAPVTVTCVAGDIELATKTEEAEVGQSYALAADSTLQKDGKTYTFSCWASDRAGETVLSTKENFQIAISSEAARSIFAIYVAQGSGSEDPVVKPIIMSDVYTSIVNGAYKLSFASTRAELPTGCTLVDTGFLYGTKQITFKDMTIKDLEEALVLGGTIENLKTQAISGSAVTNALTVNLGANSENCAMWVCARGYLRYKDANGNILTAYTDVIKTTYNIEAAKTSGNE